MDRKLDALVAEKVMGWVWKRRKGEDSCWLFPPDANEKYAGIGGIFDEKIYTLDGIVGQFEVCTQRPDKHNGASHSLPHYSSDISAAWEVVEKMAQTPHVSGFQLIDWPPDRKERWLAEFGAHNHPDDLYGQAEAPTAPLAICQAALTALEQHPSSTTAESGASQDVESPSPASNP